MNEEDIVLEELNGEGEELNNASKIKKLKEEIKQLKEESKQNHDGWMRALADYKNREIQIEKERKDWAKFAVRDFAEDLLIVLDTYDAAKSNTAVWESVDANWRSGIEYIFNTFLNKLNEKGFEKFGNVNDVFDPNLHEGLGQVVTSDESLHGKIAVIITSGYKYEGKVIRPAKVKVYSQE